MRGFKEPMVFAIMGFMIVSGIQLPPALEARAEKHARIEAHDAELGGQAVAFGRERQARLGQFLASASHERKRQGDEALVDSFDQLSGQASR